MEVSLVHIPKNIFNTLKYKNILYIQNYEKSLDDDRSRALPSPSAHNMLWSAVRVVPLGNFSPFGRLFRRDRRNLCPFLAREFSKGADLNP
jgi:hypothetical protein